MYSESGVFESAEQGDVGRFQLAQEAAEAAQSVVRQMLVHRAAKVGRAAIRAQVVGKGAAALREVFARQSGIIGRIGHR